MLFQQSTAPSGWTKDTSDTNQRALRVVSGNVGDGGSVDFTTAFGSKSVTGSVSGSVSNATAGGTVGGTSLTMAQMPDHYHFAFRSGNHGQLRNASNMSANNYPGSGSGAGNWYESYNISASGSVSNVGRTSSRGSGSSHSHSFSGSAHNHGFSGSFSGSSINLAVRYLDVIIAVKD